MQFSLIVLCGIVNLKLTIVPIIGHFLTFVKFRGNIKISWKRTNSAAWLEIPWPAENCGPSHMMTLE